MGKRETKTSMEPVTFAADVEHVDAVADSGVFSGRGLQSMLRGLYGPIVSALRWLRLLEMWQPLRRAANAALLAVTRVLYAGGSGSGAGAARRQQMVLAVASIVLIVIHMQSDGV